MFIRHFEIVLKMGLKKESDDYKEIDKCRVCSGKNLTSYLDLGDMPLANGLITGSDISLERRYPLKVAYCGDCDFSQLSVVVNPELMFSDYVYRSSISQSFRDHCSNLADELNSGVLKNGELIVD